MQDSPPCRGMKKLQAAGKLGADRIVVVNGIGGLGSYAAQYPRLLGGGATVVAFARSDEKLALAKENGPGDHRSQSGKRPQCGRTGGKGIRRIVRREGGRRSTADERAAVSPA